MPRRNPSRPSRGLQFAGHDTRPCAFPDCFRRIPPGRATCGDDWARLPSRLQRAWNQARAEEDSAGQERVLAAITAWARASTNQSAACHLTGGMSR
jgi:hypothetical protein